MQRHAKYIHDPRFWVSQRKQNCHLRPRQAKRSTGKEQWNWQGHKHHNLLEAQRSTVGGLVKCQLCNYKSISLGEKNKTFSLSKPNLPKLQSFAFSSCRKKNPDLLSFRIHSEATQTLGKKTEWQVWMLHRTFNINRLGICRFTVKCTWGFVKNAFSCSDVEKMFYTQQHNLISHCLRFPGHSSALSLHHGSQQVSSQAKVACYP